MNPKPTFSANHLMSPDVLADPYPAYHELRERSPIQYDFLPAGASPVLKETLRAWAFLKYDDVYNTLQDHGTFKSGMPTAEYGLSPRLALLYDNPPRHSRFRKLVNKAFTPQRIEALEPWVAAIAKDLIDKMGNGDVELMQSYAIPLPVKVIARLMGIPDEEYLTFRQWTEAYLSMLSMSAEVRNRRIEEMLAYFGRMAAARRNQGHDDLITALVRAEVDGELLEESEILGFCTLLLLAGSETTTNLIGNMLNILSQRPLLWLKLREDRTLLNIVIDECLRYESPIQRLTRKATRDVEVSTVRIAQGDWVSVFYGAANRDPAAFSNPDEFRLDRDLRNHVAFGSGIHYCMGAPLARMEARLTLNTLLDRFSTLTPGRLPTVRQRASFFVLGFNQLGLSFNP